MWTYVARRLLYNVPVFLGIILFLMAAVRIKDPMPPRCSARAPRPKRTRRSSVSSGSTSPSRSSTRPSSATSSPSTSTEFSWGQKGRRVGEIIVEAIPPSLAITLPALLFTSLISISVAIISAYYRGRVPDRLLVMAAVLGMSISFLVYIIIGQYFGAYRLNRALGQGREIFQISGYEGWGEWAPYCALPVMISVIVAMGYDTRFYRAVMVEESNRDYIVTAVAKGASKRKVMFVHMLKNAMIPIITRVMITLPFLIMGSFLLEMYFSIPGLGRTLITAINVGDFPLIQAISALFAAVFIVTNILTDVLYALVDPRVRLS